MSQREELRRIRWGPEPGEQPGGLGTVRIMARCAGDAEQVLQRTRAALEILCAHDNWAEAHADQGPDLPEWLTRRFAPEPSAQELKEYLKLSYEEKIRREQNAAWSRKEWLYWFQPENRYWYWWDAEARGENTIVIAVEVSEWPFPWDSLKWLLRAAGAVSVEAEE